MGQWGKQTALRRRDRKGRLMYVFNVQHPDSSVKCRLKSLWDFISLQTEWPRSRNKSRPMLARLGGKRDFSSVQVEGGITDKASMVINIELHANIKNGITIWPSYPNTWILVFGLFVFSLTLTVRSYGGCHNSWFQCLHPECRQKTFVNS